MNYILVTVLILTAVLMLWTLYKHQTQKECSLDLDGHWHVPADALEDFGLSAFVFSRDYLFIETDSHRVIFNGPVQCEVVRDGAREQLIIPEGPPFLKRVVIESAAGEDLPGLYLVGEEQELVAYVERLTDAC